MVREMDWSLREHGAYCERFQGVREGCAVKVSC